MAPLPLDLLTEAMRQAARTAILPRFRRLEPGDIAEKSGFADLVTLADTEAEALVAAALARDWPEARVMGEEGTSADPALRDAMAVAALAVILDPVDGTWNFARGLGVFGMLAAVVRQGQVAAGVLYDPLGDDWIAVSEGGPAVMCDGQGAQRVLRISSEADPARMTGFFPAALFPAAQQRAGLLAGMGFGRVTTLRCSCHEYRLMAQGLSEFVLSGPEPHPWDHAAGALAVTQAGGVARFLDGAPYDLARREGVLLTASSEAVWQQVAAAYSCLLD